MKYNTGKYVRIEVWDDRGERIWIHFIKCGIKLCTIPKMKYCRRSCYSLCVPFIRLDTDSRSSSSLTTTNNTYRLDQIMNHLTLVVKNHSNEYQTGYYYKTLKRF